MGGAIIVSRGKQGRESIAIYQCAYHKQRGPEVCKNTLRRPLATVNEQVIEWIRGALTPELVFRVVADLGEQHRRRTVEAWDELVALERESNELRREIDRPVNALALTDEKPDAMVHGIAERQSRLRDSTRRSPRSEPRRRPWTTCSRESPGRPSRPSADSTRPSRPTPDQARELVAALFEKITFTPVRPAEGPRYQLEGVAEIGRLLALDDGAKYASLRG